MSRQAVRCQPQTFPMDDPHFALKKQLREFDVPWWIILHLIGREGGVGTTVPQYNETEKRENSLGMRGGETMGLDILSINIVCPPPPFVSLLLFFLLLIDVRDARERRERGWCMCMYACFSAPSFLHLVGTRSEAP